jgi:hypothetical protein
MIFHHYAAGPEDRHPWHGWRIGWVCGNATLLLKLAIEGIRPAHKGGLASRA